MELCDRLAVIMKIAEVQPEIGKTAIMKCMYFLQNLKKVPLDYEFEIYTYGPYTSSIMDEIEFARQEGLLDIKVDNLGGRQTRYSIECSDKGKDVIATNDFINAFEAEILEIGRVFGSKSAKELELLSTIHFVGTHSSNKEKDEICNVVRKIKPRFSSTEIAQGYDNICVNF